MNVDLYTLPGEEFALIWAIEGMTLQYAWWDVLPEQLSPLALKASEVLAKYDFCSIVGERYRTTEGQSSIAFKLEARDGLINNYKYGGKIRIDTEHLNPKSKYLLIILAKLSDDFLRYDEGYLYHNSMSAGQAAFAELQTYGLLYTDKRGCGYWTDAGIAALAAFAELGDFPR